MPTGPYRTIDYPKAVKYTGQLLIPGTYEILIKSSPKTNLSFFFIKENYNHTP